MRVRTRQTESSTCSPRPFFGGTSEQTLDSRPFFTSSPAPTGAPLIQPKRAEPDPGESPELEARDAPEHEERAPRAAGAPMPPGEGAAAPIQAKPVVGSPGDPLEREADAVADQVIRRMGAGDSGADGPRLGQPLNSARNLGPATCPPSRAAPVRRRARSDGAPPSGPDVARAVKVAGQGGRALSREERGSFEPHLGRDLSAVRLHDDPAANRAASAIGARAYTFGSHIAFARGQLSPGEDAGRRLMAHELTHVIQQAEARSPSIQRDNGGAVTTPPAPITDPEQLSGSPQARPADEPLPEFVSYAFFYAGGGYGTSARRFFEVHYPEHVRVEGSSFEQMFDRLHRDMVTHEDEERRVQVDEIVIVTHANAAGGLQIPLARDDVARERNFTPWNLGALQDEFRDRTNAAYQRRQRFRERRQAVVSRYLTPSTSVVVRGCRFGQSQDGLDALRSLFGGRVYAWAPRGFQGYQVAQIGSSHLESAEEAFDMLQEQGMLPQDLELSPEEKRQYLQSELGITGAVPSEFFVMGEEDYSRLHGLIGEGRGLSEEAQEHMTREGADIPSHGELWGMSGPAIMGVDPELDRLPLEEIERRARILNDNYQPSFAPMLLRLRDAWERHPEQRRRFFEAIANPEAHPEANDPLFGLPPNDIFGDSNLLAGDAAGFRWRRTYYDSFEDETLPFAPPVEGAEAATEFDEGLGAVDEEAAAAQRRPSGRGASPSPAAAGTPGRGGAPAARQRPTPEQVEAAEDFSKDVPSTAQPPQPLDEMTEQELGQEYRRALELAEGGDSRLLTAVENEIERRIQDEDHPGFGVALPRDLPPGRPANAAHTGVNPDIGLRILENVARGEPPFRPELGEVGRVSWFVTEGNPYVGRDAASRVTIEVELVETEGRIVFREPQLLEIFEAEKAGLEATIEAQFRQRLGIDESTPLSRRMRRSLARLLDRAAEARMWERVGERVRASPSGVGEVILENSRFSRSGNGRFGVVAHASRHLVRLRGGVTHLMETLRSSGLRPDPTVTAAAEQLASRQRWAGRVRGAFRHGGRVLIVVGLANDAYRIYTARDRTRAVISSAGGWAGAVAAGALFAKVWTPADTAGPIAWVVHGVGTLVAGGVGYFVGSETTTYVYELVAED